VRALFPLLSVLWLGSVSAAPSSWLEGTVLAECEHCKSDAFTAERRTLANQVGQTLDPAAATGYIVTLEGGRFVWGRASLVGTGNLIRTDAHVLFADTGVFKARDGKIYFEPMHHGARADLIELDRSSVQRGGVLGALETDVKNDWAIARLREDAIEKFGGDRVFAFLWDVRITHDEIVKPDVMRAAALVLSSEQTFDVGRSCQSVNDDHPSRYAFGVDEVFFTRCPSEGLQAGASGSALAVLSGDDTWSLGGQLVAGGIDPSVRASAGDDTVSNSPSRRQQLFLGNVPDFEQTMAIVYLQELIRRGLDPRDR